MLARIVNFNAKIREGCEYYLLTTKDDRTLSGFIAEKDNRTLVFRGLDGSPGRISGPGAPPASAVSIPRGKNVTLPLDQIDQMERASLSLMSEGLLARWNKRTGSTGNGGTFKRVVIRRANGGLHSTGRDPLTDQQIRDLFAHLRSTQPLVRSGQASIETNSAAA